MFLKTETGEFVNVDSIQAIEVLGLNTNGDEYSIRLWMPDDYYNGAIYNNKEDAEYALNFLFSLIENTRNENRMFYEIPTQDDIETYKWADELDEETARAQGII